MGRKAYKQKAAEILIECIKDIKAGRWTCGTLSEVCPVGGDKPMGCALGLVAVNGGAVIEQRPTQYPLVPGVKFAIDYPTDAAGHGSPWPKPALLAVEALAATTRRSVSEAGAFSDTLARHQSDVIDFNDSEDMTPRKALYWFKRALAQVQA